MGLHRRLAVHATNGDATAGKKGPLEAHLALGVALGMALRQQPLPFPESSRDELTDECLAALKWAVEHDGSSHCPLYSLACMQAWPPTLRPSLTMMLTRH